MSGDAADPLGTFSGTARLFPLPDLVLFPHVVQPLHVFEPRYRRLTEDALAGDRLLALALLRPGWEEDYLQSPPVHAVVCLARIAAEQRLPDGRFNLLVQGLRRARVLEELQTGRPYRTARVQLLDDVPVDPPELDAPLRQELGRRLSAWVAAPAGAPEQLRRLLHGNLPLGALADLIAFALPAGADERQALLEEPDVARRVRRLLAHLEGLAPPPGHKFPPDFSDN
jgi:Lon protease-like protein